MFPTALPDPSPVLDYPSPAAGPLLLAAVGTALWTAAVGLACVVALVFVVWAGEPGSDSGIVGALRAGALTWLLSHGTALHLAGGPLTLPPSGLTALLLALLIRSGIGLARDTGVATPSAVVTSAVAVAAPYALAAAAVAVVAGGGAARPLPALVGSFGIALLGAGSGVAWGSGLVAQRWHVAVPPVRAVLRGAGGGLVALLGFGAALVAVAAGWHAPAVLRSAAALTPGWAGVGLLLLHIGLAPLAVTWAASYAVGTGFAVGTGTVVSPFAVQVGALPALPLLRALPAAGGGHGWVIAGPLAAGVLCGVLVTRYADWSRPRDAAAGAAMAGVLAAVALAVLVWWSSGRAGPGRLAHVGPGLLAGVVAAVELAGPAAATAWWTARRRSVAGEPVGKPLT